MDKVNILIVDGEMLRLTSLKNALNDLSYDFIHVSPDLALIRRSFSEHEFALLIFDIQQSDNLRYDLAKQIRHEFAVNTPFIFLIPTTTDSTDLDSILCDDTLGLVDFVNFPFSLSLLRAKCTHFIELYHKTTQIAHQGQLLEDAQQRIEQIVTQRMSELHEVNTQLELTNQNLLREIAERKVVEAELRFHLRRSEALYKVNQDLVAIKGLPELLQTVVDSVAQSLPADLTAIILLDLESERIIDVVVGGESQAKWYPISYDSLIQGVPGQALRTMQPVLSIKGVSRPYVEADGAILKDPGSVMVAPMKCRNQIYGVMMSITWRTEKHFRSQDMDLMAAMANQAAIAISHADLFDETRRSLKQVRQIIHAVPSGVILLDADRRVQLVNPIAEEYLATLAMWDENDCLIKLGDVPLSELIVSGTVQYGETRRFLIGSRYFQLATRPLNDENEQDQWLVVLRDVSIEMAALDHQLTQQRQAMVGQLAAGVAHDFNNILAVITLYCQLLEKTPLPERYEQYLKTILQQSQRGASLVSQLLDFSRQSLMKPTSVDLVPFLRDILNLLSRTFPENIHLQFVTHVESLYLHVDPTHLQQVFMNLSINARDAMASGGLFEIILDTIDIGLNEHPPVPGMVPGMWVSVSVTDTGCGIPAEIQDKVFEPFFTTKAPDKGTGLGLAQVYGIIQQLGGEITVSSVSNEGSTFGIYLPIEGLASVPLRSHPHIIQRDTTQGDKTILLVEDDLSVRSALQEMLRSLGFHDLLLAENGQEALAFFRTSKREIHLVFSDMVMPQMGGLELFEVLRTKRPDIKMIISTGYPLENGGEALLALGIADWVLKPFSIEEVSTKIYRALSS